MTANPNEHTKQIDQTEPDAPGATTLSVRTLKLSDFRNYATARLDLDARPVVLVGDNGSGKTNLLEAVSLLGPGHGVPDRAASVVSSESNLVCGRSHRVNRPWRTSFHMSS